MSIKALGRSHLIADKGAASSSFTRFIVMVQKELLELVRSYKLLWVPLVYLLLGIMQPVSTYFMPVILEQAGSLPEGTVIEIPKPLGSEVLAQTLQQFGTLGVLVLVLVCMGTVSGERNNGTASLILVKPISVLVLYRFQVDRYAAAYLGLAHRRLFRFLVLYGSVIRRGTAREGN